MVSAAIHAPFIAVLPIIIYDDALIVSVEDAVLVLSVADVAIVVGNDGSVLAAAFVFTSSVGIVGIAPEVGIAVVFRFYSTICAVSYTQQRAPQTRMVISYSGVCL